MRAVLLVLHAFLIRGLELVCLFYSPCLVGGFHCFLFGLITSNYKSVE
jgi:hypothetical protein